MSKKKSSRKKWFFILIIVIVGTLLGSRVLQKKDNRTEVTMKAVERGDITSVVTATGNVQPEVEVVITSEVPGEIIELPVKDGDPVKRGDLLVRVNPDTLEAQVKQQEASLASTRASAAQRRAEMLQAELDLKRLEDLHNKGFTTQDDLDQSRTRLEVAKAAHESARYQIERQEMQLKEANDQLAKASLYAPIDGTVVSLASELGDRVVGTGQFAGTEIMRVADLGNMEVKVDVSEADIVNIEIGDTATIEVDALGDDKLSGTVTEIANSAVTTNARSQEQLTTFSVIVKLDTPATRLRPGMSATADIQTDTVKDVIKVPLGSVVVRSKNEVEGKKDTPKEASEERPGNNGQSNGGKERGPREERVRVVFIEKDGIAHLRKVETGIADRDSIEIKSGIEETDTIITGSYSALTRELKDGSAVKERESKRPSFN
jgi:HlyD family secretion protein